MYIPKHFASTDHQQILEMLRGRGFGVLVSHGLAGDSGFSLQSTALPFVVDDEIATVRAHLAKANAHWRHLDGAEVLLVVQGTDAYVSPRWYPSKMVDGKVVPTWNYELVRVRGVASVRHDDAWKREMVSDLTDLHEARESALGGGTPWAVDDAPDGYLDGMVKAIVGVEVRVTEVGATRKLSQNRAEDDRLGAIEGLSQSPDPSAQALAERMADPRLQG